MQTKNKVIIRITIFVILVLCFFYSLFNFIYLVRNRNKEEILYSYQLNKNVDYNVSLFENNFIDDKILKSDRTYISDLVNTINIKYMFDFINNDLLDIEYSYRVNAKIVGKYNQSNEGLSEVWNRLYELKKSDIIKTSSNFSIRDEIVIDYQKYINEVRAFKLNVGINVDASLELSFIIDYNVLDKNESTNIKLLIPIGEQAFMIKRDYKNDEVINIYNENKNNRTSQLIINFVLLFLSSSIFTIVYKKIFVFKRTRFERKLTNILRKYGDIIVELVSRIDESNYEVIIVKDFKELIDIEEEVRIPINFYVLEKHYLGEFFIIKDKILYKYILTNE